MHDSSKVRAREGRVNYNKAWARRGLNEPEPRFASRLANYRVAKTVDGVEGVEEHEQSVHEKVHLRKGRYERGVSHQDR